MLIGTKGNIKKLVNEDKTANQVLFSKITLHSKKPTEVYDIFRKKFNLEQTRNIEIFARECTMENFDVYGNEIPGNFKLSTTLKNYMPIHTLISKKNTELNK